MTDRNFFDVGNWNKLTPEEKRQVASNIASRVRRDFVEGDSGSFDPEVRDAVTSAERLEKQLNKELKFLTEFEVWRLEHQIRQYRHFAKCQAEGVHELATVIDGCAVCTCGRFEDGSSHIN